MLTEKGKGKLVVGSIDNGVVRAEFVFSVLAFRELDWRSRHACIGTISKRGLYLAENRNFVVQKFLELDAEWLLFIDSDISFRRESIYHLLDSADPITRPIVSGLYFSTMHLATNGDPNRSDVFTPVWVRPTSVSCIDRSTSLRQPSN